MSDPIVTALVLALREIAERRAAERSERRGGRIPARRAPTPIVPRENIEATS